MKSVMIKKFYNIKLLRSYHQNKGYDTLISIGKRGFSQLLLESNLLRFCVFCIRIQGCGKKKEGLDSVY